MDDARIPLTTRMAVVVAVAALTVLAGAQVAGEQAVAPLLLAALATVAYVVSRNRPGRPARATAVDVPRQRQPEWYSERWVQENVERGLRSLEEWRREQPSR